MSAFNLKTQWDTVKTYLSSSAAANTYALSPRPTVIRGQPEQIEDRFRCIIVDLLDFTQDRARAAANNTHQTFNTTFRLYVAARGSSMDDADDKCLAIVSAVVEDLVGTGAFLNTNRSTVFAAVLESGSWDPANDDSLTSEFILNLTVTFYRN